MNAYAIPGIIPEKGRAPIHTVAEMMGFLSPGDVVERVCRIWEIQREDLFAPSKGRIPVSEARSVCVFLMIHRLGFSLHGAAAFFKRDRNTPRHNIKVVKNLYDTDKSFRSKFHKLINAI